MTTGRKKLGVKPVLPLSDGGAEHSEAKEQFEELRRERRKRARDQAFWAGRTLAARRSAREAA